MMGSAIIQQPDGKFCIFSTITDTMAIWDATEDDVMTYMIQSAVDSTVRSTRHMLDRATGVLPRMNLGPTYEEAVEDHNNRCHPHDRIKVKD